MRKQLHEVLLAVQILFEVHCLCQKAEVETKNVSLKASSAKRNQGKQLESEASYELN